MTSNAMIRPAWTPATIALMVLGFMVFWPLGLAMLAYIIWGDRLESFKTDVNRSTDGFFRACRRGAARFEDATRGEYGGRSPSGNVAFDAWRDSEIDRLNEERRKLDEMRAEFDAHMRDLRMARDREEFESFMARRNESTSASSNEAPGAPELQG
ncbi:DUF2852 domain-containing protein [Pseudohoeflea coraliihabitans]|uniref:DUF2852 domain-containing protein n=1 Tax=Pseudohoeflea coraliihabitans TaxID=2860393 RepID=A0ABS6WT01_9HYPH|nr:DUF2852 domain-containing protein [Pseudohoeflea sp. DP4N28-3]MBW3099092.1 DUF2852 domain-containing protein [Pseudohoeflea sp. DP4N28-3]